jgi:protein TonB
VYSKVPLTASALVPVCEKAGIRTEVCTDVFSAIEKGTKQPFSCLIVDWSDQPEAGFVAKRARESAVNQNAVVIAVVDHEPASVEVRANRLDFLIYRPIAEDEAAAVLTKARQQMQLHSAALGMDLQSSLEPSGANESSATPEDPNRVPVTGAVPGKHQRFEPSGEITDEALAESDLGGEQDADVVSTERSAPVFTLRAICAGVLALAASFCLWQVRDTIHYLAHTREGVLHVFHESLAALLLNNQSGSQAVGPVAADSQRDAYFERTNPVPGSQPSLGIVSTEASVPETYNRLPRAFDFPLPTPQFTPPALPPIHSGRTQVPESLRGSSPIGPPTVAVPTQIAPVSVPVPMTQTFSEPVHLSEEAARALLVRTVEPAYPAAAAAQKLQGSVVLQAVIGRDGSVEDLKLVRGYFVLGRAAIAAVKQWRFQPYVVNGHAAATQTTFTINFTRPRA